MIKYIKYRWRLELLNQQFDKEMANCISLQKQYFGRDDEGHLSIVGQNLMEVSSEIEHLKTAYLKSEADKYVVPMPDQEDKSMYKEIDFGYDDGPLLVLTVKGMHDVRANIRAEKKARREIAAFWIGSLTGLVGAAIGLISTIKQ